MTLTNKLLLPICLGVLSACSIGKKLDKMQSSTDSLGQKVDQTNKTVEVVAKNSEELNQTSQTLVEQGAKIGNNSETLVENSEHAEELADELLETATESGKDVKQATAFAREIALQALKDPKQSKTLREKIVKATKFVSALEFQISEVKTEENRKIRSELIKEGVLEFFSTWADLESSVSANYINKIDPSTDDNDEQGLLALSFAVDAINRKQYRNERLYQVKPQSIFGVIEQALLLRPGLESGDITTKDLKLETRAVLSDDSSRAVDLLLQARFNTMLGAAFEKLHEKRVGLFEGLKLVRFDWVPNLKSLNPVELEECIAFLDKAIHTRTVMYYGGLRPRPHTDLINILKNLDIEKMSRTNTKAGLNSYLPALEERLQDLLRSR